MHPHDWRLISSRKENQSSKNRQDHQLRNGERAGNLLPVRETLAGCRGAAMTGVWVSKGYPLVRSMFVNIGDVPHFFRRTKAHKKKIALR